MHLIIKKVVAKGTPIYVCSECGAKAAGDAVTLELDGIESNPSDIGHMLLGKSQYVSNNHMPVGWAGYGKGIHKCPDCTT